MIENKQYIDIWEHILVVLKRKPSIQILSFMSTFAFGNTMKKTSDIFQIRPSEIKLWNQRIITEIKSLCIQRGINIKNITNLIGDNIVHETPKNSKSDKT